MFIHSAAVIKASKTIPNPVIISVSKSTNQLSFLVSTACVIALPILVLC